MPAKSQPAENSALFIATIVATGSIAINAAIPDAAHIESSFGLDAGTGARIVGTFVAGYAIGHILAGDRLKLSRRLRNFAELCKNPVSRAGLAQGTIAPAALITPLITFSTDSAGACMTLAMSVAAIGGLVVILPIRRLIGS